MISLRITVADDGTRSAYQWLLTRVLTSLEEPKEHVGCWVEANVAGIVVNTLGGFADAGLSGLFVPNLGTLGRLDRGNASRVSRDLTLHDKRRAGAAKRCGRQDGSDLSEARHGGKLIKEKNSQGFNNCLPR